MPQMLPSSKGPGLWYLEESIQWFEDLLGMVVNYTTWERVAIVVLFVVAVWFYRCLKASANLKCEKSLDMVLPQPAGPVSKSTSVPNSSWSSISADESHSTGEETGSSLNGFPATEHSTDELPSLDFTADMTADVEVDDRRIKAFPHSGARIEGLLPLFTQLLSEVLKIAEMKHLEWTMVDEPHISLSRTVVLHYGEIPRFTAHLKSEIRKSSTPRFLYALEDVEIYCNDPANTTFLALRVGSGREELKGLVKIIDSCLRNFSVPQHHDRPELHLSFAWCPQQLSDDEKHRVLHSVRKRLQSLELQFAGQFEQCAKALHCRSGNRSYLMPL